MYGHTRYFLNMCSLVKNVYSSLKNCSILRPLSANKDIRMNPEGAIFYKRLVLKGPRGQLTTVGRLYSAAQVQEMLTSVHLKIR